MSILTIRASAEGKPLDPDAASELRFDLEREVGTVQLPAASHQAGAKGSAVDLATLAVAVLSAPAINALIGVLKARIERDDSTEFSVEGPGGKISFKGRDKSLMSSTHLFRLIEGVLGQREGESGDASSSPDRSQPI